MLILRKKVWYVLPSYELNWNNLLSADLAWQMSKKSLEANRDALVLKTCKSYWDVQSAQEKVDVQRKLEQQALLNLQNVRAGLQAGTVPPSAIVAVEGQWNRLKITSKLLKKPLMMPIIPSTYRSGWMQVRSQF
ncbi:TolC family protein [Moorella naiadis (nom. illeg.)]|uniref:TolC family protein n=1 Tax=Moorella naiadis (nom. illeg.) TaxID=3093670 RepID=UPI003D9C89CF